MCMCLVDLSLEGKRPAADVGGKNSKPTAAVVDDRTSRAKHGLLLGAMMLANSAAGAALPEPPILKSRDKSKDTKGVAAAGGKGANAASVAAAASAEKGSTMRAVEAKVTGGSSKEKAKEKETGKERDRERSGSGAGTDRKRGHTDSSVVKEKNKDKDKDKDKKRRKGAAGNDDDDDGLYTVQSILDRKVDKKVLPRCAFSLAVASQVLANASCGANVRVLWVTHSVAGPFPIPRPLAGLLGRGQHMGEPRGTYHDHSNALSLTSASLPLSAVCVRIRRTLSTSPSSSTTTS
jgi:hypothetical protein